MGILLRVQAFQIPAQYVLLHAKYAMGQILIHVFHVLIIITLVEPSAYLAIYHASIAPMKELAHAQLVDLLIRYQLLRSLIGVF